MKDGNEMVEKNSINSKSQQYAAVWQNQWQMDTNIDCPLHTKPRCLLRQRGFTHIILYLLGVYRDVLLVSIIIFPMRPMLRWRVLQTCCERLRFRRGHECTV